MNDSKDHEYIARYLADMWSMKCEHLPEFLDSTFSYSSSCPISCDRLFIAEMADGDVAADNMGGMYARKWVLENGRLREVEVGYAYREMYETDPSKQVYLSSSYLFCCDGSAVLLSERYGPNLRLRLRGQVRRDEGLTIDWTVLWT